MKSTLTLLLGLMLFSTLHAQVPAYVPTDGLVGWWPFNGNANDESGNGNDGVVNGATLTEDRFGNANAAYGFDGVDDFIEYSESINNLNFPITIAAFLQIPTQDVNGSVYDFMVFSSDESPSSYSGIWFAASENTVELSFGGNGPRNSLITPTGMSRGTWVQVVGVINGPNDMAIYLDGNNVDGAYSGTAASMIDLGYTSTSAYYNTNNGLETYQSGLLDDIAIFNRALTEQEIQNLYAGTTPAACPSLSANLQTGLVGYWPFCGNANDESGNGNDGVVNGATLTEDRFGNANAAFNFLNNDTSLSEIILDEVPALSNQDWSISFWINTSNSLRQGIITLGNDNVTRDCIQIFSIEQLRYNLHNVPGPFTSGGIADANWHHVTVMNFDGNGHLYFDGVFQGSTLGMNPNIGVSGTRRFGGARNIDGNIWRMNGLLDDIAIWNRALTPEEVQELYTGITPTPAPCVALPANLQEGIVGYWPFCGNANDESGNGNDGVVNGATLTEDRFGNANAAYGFDGVDDFIESPFEGVTGSAARSLSYWSRTSSTEPMSCVSWGGNGVGPFRGNRFQGGYNYVTNGVLVGGSDCAITYNGTSPVSDGEWHHYAFIMNENDLLQEVDVFQDGTLLLDEGHIYAGNTALVTEISTMLQFGRVDYANAYDFLNGTLDDIAIWNRALTPAEVQELYTLDACTFTVYDTLTVENIINVYDTLTIENIVDIYDTTYINVEVYDTLTVENIINVYDTLTIENIVEVYDTLTIENVIDVYDTTTVVETEVVYDTLTIENIVDVYDTLTIENVIDVYDTTTFVETITVYDTLTVENVEDVYDTTYVTVTDTLIIDIPSGVGGNILNTLLLYPNPTSDQLTISYGNFAAMAGFSLSIFDNGGSSVHETNITQAQETLDISQWSAGVYQVVVYNAGGVPVETRQIVIQ